MHSLQPLQLRSITVNRLLVCVHARKENSMDFVKILLRLLAESGNGVAMPRVVCVSVLRLYIQWLNTFNELSWFLM